MVVPVSVLLPERINNPLPDCTTLPVPLISSAKSVLCVTEFERLKTSVSLLMIVLLVERLPVEPPKPIWMVPAPTFRPSRNLSR